MFRMSLNRVHDTVRVSEGHESIMLKVDADAGRMVAGIAEASRALQELSAETSEEDQRKAARYFASVIFGDEGAARLMEFYRDDPTCVINLCAQYFSKRLGGLITKAQKKSGVK